ncbi:OmpA family protein [Salaquimonas pukyongi]|uniref:OmpA family protein n=1 Tax=Salaquimonas pukyongi TaxID=2712698 RepID=UPI00096B72E5|nr:OmpA family protein [Salaquimonas pukyongi]
MCNWKKWIWPGILATVLLTALAMLMRSGAIEQDLQAKALERLSADHDWAQVALDGRDLTLLGVAPSEEAASQALKIAEDAYDVRVATSQTTLLPVADPFTLSATKGEGGNIALSGSVPSEQIRSAIVEAAKAAGSGEVDDQLVLNRGASDGFSDLASFGISQLGGFVTGKASLVNSDLSVEGVAATADDYAAITSALSGTLPGGGKLAASSVVAPAVSPYRLAVETSPEGMVLSGYVPDAASRAALVQAAQAVSDQVTDNLELASGVPDGISWADAGNFAISAASRLLKGTAAFSDTVFSIDGMARDAGARGAIEGDLAGALPAGVSVGSSNIELPLIDPYEWRFENMEGSAPVLSGYQPDEGFGAANLEMVTTALGTAQPVVNNLAVGQGAPAGFADAAAVAIRAASRLHNASAQITGTEVTVSGEAYSLPAAEQVRAMLDTGLPEGFTGNHEIALRDTAGMATLGAEECQALLSSFLKTNSIRFESGKANIQSISFGLLDRLSFALKRCPTATVEIGGHTDADGSQEANLALSENRANSVRSYLVRNGVFIGRLQAKGYGESSPVADNATDEGKAQNRRIEFTVIR